MPTARNHAQLFIMSSLLWTIDPDGEKVTTASMLKPEGPSVIAKYFPNKDIHLGNSSAYRTLATNIYKTKDARFFHLHGTQDHSQTAPKVVVLGT